MQVDREVPLRFLRTAFLPNDWIAVLLKRHDTGEAVQRVAPLEMVLRPRFQAWLRFKNAERFSVFVSINALTPGRRSRTRESVVAVRHVFLDADQDAEQVLSAIERRSDLPKPSVVVRSSRGRAHVLWRVAGVSVERAEALQKHLARDLGTDPAATSAAQMTRLPGLLNYKHDPPSIVALEHRSLLTAYRADQFPAVSADTCAHASAAPVRRTRHATLSAAERARRYLAATPGAVQGQSGDARTFRTCCRLVGTFQLTDAEALGLLEEWNVGCRPPWSEPELLQKLRSARRASGVRGGRPADPPTGH